jgi:hypothetical protein
LFAPTTPPAHDAPTVTPQASVTSSLISPEEVADRVVPTNPRISPDGSRVVFAATPASQKGEHWTQALWIAAEGAPAR